MKISLSSSRVLAVSMRNNIVHIPLHRVPKHCDDSPHEVRGGVITAFDLRATVCSTCNNSPSKEKYLQRDLYRLELPLMSPNLSYRTWRVTSPIDCLARTLTTLVIYWSKTEAVCSVCFAGCCSGVALTKESSQ